MLSPVAADTKITPIDTHYIAALGPVTANGGNTPRSSPSIPRVLPYPLWAVQQTGLPSADLHGNGHGGVRGT
jgi:hypothetical protein